MTTTLAVLYGMASAAFLGRGWAWRKDNEGRALLVGGLALGALAIGFAVLSVRSE